MSRRDRAGGCARPASCYTCPRHTTPGGPLLTPARTLLAAAAALVLPAAAGAAPPLRWGCDPTGGAPFIFRDADQKYVGFEVDLAGYVAKALGREAQMVPGDWSNLPQLLDKPAAAGGIDVVLNGYEFQPDLAKQFTPTRPYYVYRIALMSRKNDDEIRGWADLHRPRAGGRKKDVGVLGGTVAQDHVKGTFGDDVNLLSNPDVANVIKLVADGRLDCTAQDGPAASYYLGEYPQLKLAGEPVRPGFYVMYHRKGDAELGAKLNEAIAAGIQSGEFKRIYKKYRLWNDDQERLSYWQTQPWPPGGEADDAAEPGGQGKADEPAANPLRGLFGELALAALVTIQLAVLSFPLAMAIGLTVAVGRVYGPRWLGVLLGVYVEVVRGTPLLLQLYMIYYLVPELLTGTGVPWLAAVGGWLTPTAAGVLGLAVNYSAYEAENYRAGLLAIPRGQLEAAQALGMTPATAVRRVVVPQAVRLVIPPVTNDFIALFKDTSACSIILVVELTRKYNELFNFNRGLIVQLAFLTAGLYLLMSYPLAVAAGRLEKHLGTGPRGAK